MTLGQTCRARSRWAAPLGGLLHLALFVLPAAADTSDVPMLISDHANSRMVWVDDMLGTNWQQGPSLPGLSVNRPWHAAFDSVGRMYIADRDNKRIVRMDDLAGNGWKTWSGTPPVETIAVAVDPTGVIYLTEYTSRIERMDDMDGTGWTTLGRNSDVNAEFGGLKGIILDPQGRIYTTDFPNNRVVRVDDMQATGWVTFGTAGSGVGQFDYMEGLALDSLGRIYITDNHNNRIVRIDDMTGAGWVTFGSLGTGVGNVWEPHDIAIDDTDRIYIADTGNHRIVRIDDMTGAGWVTFGSNGFSGPNVFQAPKGIRLFLPSDLSVTVTDGRTSVLAGSSVTYTITVANAGPRNVAGARVVDAFPAAVTSVAWTCAVSGGASCGGGGGSGNIDRLVKLPLGGTVTFTANATINPAATGTLSNMARTSVPSGRVDAVTGNNSATDTDTLIPATDLTITKTDGQTTAAPGQVLSYTMVVHNAGPNVTTGATVLDPVPTSLTSVTWSCSGSSGATCAAAGAGSINDTVNLPVNTSATYTLTGTVSASPTHVRNTATVAVPPGMGDPNPADNAATDDDTLFCFAETIVVPDGRVSSSTIAAGATAWFAASLGLDNSYSLTFTGEEASPGTVTVFAGDDGCSLVSSLTPRDTTGIDARTGGSSRRVSFRANGIEPFFRARLENGSGTAVPFTFVLSDTTLFSAAWTTNGAFNTYYSFQNTTDVALNGTVTLRDTTGLVVATSSFPLPAGRTTSANTAALGVPRGKTGTARFTHDGPPGAVVAGAAIASFATAPAYVQPVKFQAQRE